MEPSDLNDILNVRTVKMESVDNVFEEAASGAVDTSDPLSVIPQYVTESDLGLMPTGVEILQTPLAVFEDATEDDDTMLSTDSSEEVIVQLMDIRTKLSKLRSMLERRLGVDLSDYTFWLQDAKMLENHKTLVEQCIRGSGVVQVNVQVRAGDRKINILDVLKPDEELPNITPEIEETVIEESEVEPEREPPHAAAVKWVVDAAFKLHHTRVSIPDDPADWSVQHVKLWIQWAVRQFNLTGVKLSDWHISGWTLCALTNLDFKEKVPSDPGDLFWTHFELLRKCKFIAVVQNPNQSKQDPLELSQSAIKKRPKMQVIHRYTDEEATFAHTRNGNNGQVQLWQFLLELLTSAEHLDVIRWHGTEGEFKLLEPERVARLWGARKHKPAMNYEKLSRALRYYYDGDMIAKVAGKRKHLVYVVTDIYVTTEKYLMLMTDIYDYDGYMIAKVAGKRFVYKFVCDLQQLLGYGAAELAELVQEVHENRQTDEADEWAQLPGADTCRGLKQNAGDAASVAPKQKSKVKMQVIDEEPPPKSPSEIILEERLRKAEERKNRFKRKWPEIVRPPLNCRRWHPPGPPRRPSPIVSNFKYFT